MKDSMLKAILSKGTKFPSMKGDKQIIEGRVLEYTTDVLLVHQNTPEERVIVRATWMGEYREFVLDPDLFQIEPGYKIEDQLRAGVLAQVAYEIYTKGLI